MKRLVIAATVAFISFQAATASAYMVYCKDGTISYAGGKSGACSHHGGVAGGPPSGSGSTAPPVDSSPPTIVASAPTTSGGPVSAGKPVTPPAFSVSDDVAWPYQADGYPATVDWGDGSAPTVVRFFPSSLAYVSVSVTAPAHTYVTAGAFTITVTVLDPAGRSTTATLLTATVVQPVAAPERYPRLSGTPRVGRLMSCRAGFWAPDAQIKYRWLINGNTVPGRFGRQFRLRKRDVGSRVACRVLAVNEVSSGVATSSSKRVGRKR